MKELTQLVFENNQCLLLFETGRLHADWYSSFLALFEEEKKRVENLPYWDWSFFKAIHYSSCYLYIRYDAWSAFNQKRNVQTENILRDVQLEIEKYFLDTAHKEFYITDNWKHCNLDIFGAFNFDKKKLHFLQSTDGALLESKKSFLVQLNASLDSLVDDGNIQKLVALTLHYCSFYRDFALKYRSSFCVDEHNVDIPSSSCILAPIGLWLDYLNGNRDSSGIPILKGWPEREYGCYSLRSEIESIIY